MAAVEVVLREDLNLWAVTVYAFDVLPIHLYHWLLARCLQPSDSCILRLELSREARYEPKEIGCDLAKPIVKREWIVCRILGSYSVQPTEEKVYDYCFDHSPMTPYLKSREEIGEEVEVLIGKLANKSNSWLSAAEEAAKESEALGHARLADLGRKFRVLGGHWSAYFAEQENKKAAFAWRRMLRGFLLGGLESACGICFRRTPGKASSVSASSAVTTAISSGDPMEDKRVFRLEKEIRVCGLLRMLKFKPDIYSACGINHNSQKKLRPTVYKSQYNNEKMESLVVTDYTEGYYPEVAFKRPLNWYSAYLPCNLKPAQMAALDKQFLYRLIPAMRIHRPSCDFCRFTLTYMI